MAVIDIKEVSRLNGTQILHSKANFDTIKRIEKKRPEFVDSGTLNNRDSDESAKLALDNPSLAESPNFYKHNGYVVENSGYFSFPRSISEDPRYKGARLKYKHVLHIILENAAFGKTTHSIGLEIINIEIGQLCISERWLVELCNQGVKFKDDMVDKNTVRRAVHFFSRCGFVNHKVIHDKTLITVTVPEFYMKIKKESEPASEPEVNQKRTTKETDKTDKVDNISTKKEGTFVPSEFATSLLTEFYSSLFLSIPDYPKDSARKTKAQYEAADRIGKKANGDMELIRKVIAYAHVPGGFWISHVHSVTYLDKKFVSLVQQMRGQGMKPMNGQKPESLHNKSFNKDTSPKKYNNTYDFSKPKEEKK